ncbi:ABC transporter [Campylobacter lari]|nr:ABC transporter [Campylobacter lari]EAK0445059.1 ABC transporter [Campylobacter lari]EAK9943713.1 ABC transporter [Campylobacter lari]
MVLKLFINISPFDGFDSLIGKHYIIYILKNQFMIINYYLFNEKFVFFKIN